MYNKLRILQLLKLNIYIAQLQGVQRRFLKSAVFMLDGLYPPRGYPQELLLERLGLQSLSNRRLEHSVIFLYKLFHGSLHCPALLSRVNLRVPRSGSRSTNTFLISHYTISYGRRSSVSCYPNVAWPRSRGDECGYICLQVEPSGELF
jgi:hypothetical protein